MKYCSDCGTRLETKKEAAIWYCLHCKRHFYANPIPTIDAVLFDEKGRILLGRRAVQPTKGKLNLPGGYVDPNENLEQAIARELYEELGLKPSDYSKLSYSSSRIETFTEEGKPRQLIPVMVLGDINHQEFEANQEVSEYIWKLPSELKSEDLTTQGEYEHIMKAVAVWEVTHKA